MRRLSLALARSLSLEEVSRLSFTLFPFFEKRVHSETEATSPTPYHPLSFKNKKNHDSHLWKRVRLVVVPLDGDGHGRVHPPLDVFDDGDGVDQPEPGLAAGRGPCRRLRPAPPREARRRHGVVR